MLALVRAPPAVAVPASSRPARQDKREIMGSIQSPLVGLEINLPAQISDLSLPQLELGHHDDSPTRADLSTEETNKWTGHEQLRALRPCWHFWCCQLLQQRWMKASRRKTLSPRPALTDRPWSSACRRPWPMARWWCTSFRPHLPVAAISRRMPSPATTSALPRPAQPLLVFQPTPWTSSTNSRPLPIFAPASLPWPPIWTAA